MKKELTVKDIVIIAIILVGIIASFIPTINNHPGSDYFLKLASILIIIIFTTMYISIKLMDKDKNGVPALIIGVIAFFITAFVSYTLTKPNLTSGRVVGKYWETKIVVIKPETNNSDEKVTKTPTLSGDYTKPVEWKEYELASGEEEKSRTLTYTIMVWADGIQTEYVCNYADWNELDINQPIEFTFTQHNMAIDRIY